MRLKTPSLSGNRHFQATILSRPMPIQWLMPFLLPPVMHCSSSSSRHGICTSLLFAPAAAR
jgi:hypothetical protein